ncbi:MAG TPA: hypothetical protein VEF76_01460, partial [Patescibacteria group bacterium]|nr:hypothetical protein [Patescibacteria group bacterium]
EWYGLRNVLYGEGAMNFIGSIKNIPGAHPRESSAEFRAFGWMPGSSIDVTRPEELHRLGKSFTGKNYLDHAPREAFDRQFLSQGLARQFFDAARKPDAIAVALRKKELQDRRQERNNTKAKPPRSISSSLPVRKPG